MGDKDKTPTEEHLRFRQVFDTIVEKCAEYCKGQGNKKKGNFEKMGACMYSEDDDVERTLYSKVHFNPDKKKFYTKFRKTKVKKGEDKEWDPEVIENEMCEAMGVVCFESIYQSASHTTLQVKLDEVAMNFDNVKQAIYASGTKRGRK